MKNIATIVEKNTKKNVLHSNKIYTCIVGKNIAKKRFGNASKQQE